MKETEFNRKILKGYYHDENNPLSDQRKNIPQPPLETPYDDNLELIDLPDPGLVKLVKSDLRKCINERISHRKFSNRKLSLEELSFLLYSTQGVKKRSDDDYYVMRTVPSGGARHAFETYLGINSVENLKPGIYRYISLKHKLLYISSPENQKKTMSEFCCNQKFCGEAPVLFAWSAVPYRVEWRYGNYAAKDILLDAGHVCQNLYLACEALGLGTCAIAAYVQDDTDNFFRLDGKEEFIIYLSPVGEPA